MNLEGEWCETSTGENFLISDTGDEDKILIFGTAGNLRRLSEATTIYADGTYASPGIFKQLYTFHALIDNEMFPLVFALLPDKNQTTYIRLLNELKTAAINNNSLLNPETIFIDFECACRNVAETVLW